MIAPDVAQLATQLAEVIARNAGSAVVSKISAIRARKLDQAAMNELSGEREGVADLRSRRENGWFGNVRGVR